ncbi:MAG TPA: M23 family metallopeptidase [Acidimicrobiales bacterium]|jgi:hypothetical protein|nr:M23 family metallopeptidase [Acidimicrobiales bacterium]
MRRLCAAALLVTISALPFHAAPAGAAEEGPEYRQIHFPVEGPVSFSDDFNDPRSGGRSHEGNDLMGEKLQKLLAAVDGTVTSARLDAGGLSGNMLTIRDADGWQYRYIHINNDTPGTDDGLNPPEWVFGPGIAAGVKVRAGQHVAYLGDSGNAENTAPHLHFEIRAPDGNAINPWTSLRLAKGMPAGTRCAYNQNPKRSPTARAGAGYYVLGADGGIFTFGAAPFLGSVPGLDLKSKVTALRLSSTSTGLGYHILGADGGIFTFGDAGFFGSVPGLGLTTVKALDLRPTPTGKGYWILGDDGGVFTFGDAGFFGSVPGLGIRTKAIRLVPTATGRGYWVLGEDGGVFSFGDASFFGSVPGLGIPAAKVIAMAASPGGSGYWVLAADGGVFSFGVPFYGSIPGVGLCQWPRGVQMTSTATGKGYWVVGDDGSVWAFGDAPDHADVKKLGLTVRAVDLAAIPAK